ncbi:hypothetical protein Q8A67_016973 [Cirrhinus molitorella]|uniref:Uncharacterized protein n=1 Tax=Cirrhinus molitorella TaxID=172907 RepID=A0AA88PKY6_9TELE|nr:hypothetical protein Q8A67_016973 [Cirrhinus molitorella]
MEKFVSTISDSQKLLASMDCHQLTQVLLLEGNHKLNGEELEKVLSCVTDGTDSVRSFRDQLSEQRSRDTQDTELSLSLLCSSDA